MEEAPGIDTVEDMINFLRTFPLTMRIRKYDGEYEMAYRCWPHLMYGDQDLDNPQYEQTAEQFYKFVAI
ncbi:MAG: hypothetical protein KGI54_13225 [Pseudomonadota bacterium]|nr:hypothetical protein [Pseudomonadota bacterium]